MRSIETRLLEKLPETQNEVLRRLCSEHPRVLAGYAGQGPLACREDAANHVEYLAAAVGFGEATPFLDYLRWLADVWHARELPLEGLETTLRVLREYYAGLPETWAGEAVRHLDAGLAELGLRGEFLIPAGQDRGRLPATGAMLEALLAGDRHLARAVAGNVLAAGCSLAQLGARLIQPSMYEIGALWQKNRISVAQEHLATAITQYVLAQAFAGAEALARTQRRALFANVETNHHALGLRLVADVFDLAGWSIQYLGADVPTRALLEQVDTWGPELLGLSVSMPQQFAHVRAAIGALRAEFGSRCPTLMLGGQVLNRYDRAADRLGADLHVRDAMAADDLAREQ